MIERILDWAVDRIGKLLNRQKARPPADAKVGKRALVFLGGESLWVEITGFRNTSQGRIYCCCIMSRPQSAQSPYRKGDNIEIRAEQITSVKP